MSKYKGSDKQHKIFDVIEIDPMLISQVNWGEGRQIDQLSFSLQRDSKFAKDQKPVMKIGAPVSHAGRLTKNRGLYIPSRMADSAEKWSKPYKKPVLRHHDDGKNPIGRVQFAQFESGPRPQFVGADKWTDQAFFSVLRDLMKEGLVYDAAFEGMGALKAVALITDKDAIEEILDERILTFSIGFNADNIYSPFNGKSIFELEDDEPGPWDTVDGMKGFRVAGAMDPHEFSAVPIPADELAILEYKELGFYPEADSAQQQDNKRVMGVYELFDSAAPQQASQENTMQVKDFCGPNQTYLVTSVTQGEEALAQLSKDSTLSDVEKARVEKAVKIKMASLRKEQASAPLLVADFQDRIAGLSFFELQTCVDQIKTALLTTCTADELIEMFDLNDSAKLIQERRVLDQKVSTQNLQLAKIQDTLQETQIRHRAALIDGLKLLYDLTGEEPHEHVRNGTGSEEQLTKLYAEKLQDKALLERIELFKAGHFTKPVEVAQADNPVQQPSTTASEDVAKFADEFEQIISDQYNKKKEQDGEAKAKEWLEVMKIKHKLSAELCDKLKGR